jgi:N-acyl-D-amino-acid deacylase
MVRCLLSISSLLVFTACVVEIALVANAQVQEPLPKTGFSAPGLASFDEKMVAIMTKWRLPGGQLVMAKDGRLVLNRAYGYADREKRETVRTDSLFRVGSVSKTITTVAILILVDTGRLRLDDKVFEILSDLKPPKGATMDPRLRLITIQQLLRHEGGWADHDALELPWSRMAAAALGQADPPECETIIRYAIGRPLDFAPGTKSSYSNFGFCVLGRVIERAASVNRRISYEDYVRDAVLNPSGVTRMRIGGTRAVERESGEVRYYASAGRPLVPSVYAGEGYVPFAYGGFYLRASDAAGGWIGSAEDLVRFATAIDGQRAGLC